MKLLSKHKIELGIFLGLIGLYFLLRLPNLTQQPVFADEAIYIHWAQLAKAEASLRFISLTDGKTPLFMWLLIPFFKVFHDPLFAGRFLSILSGLGTMLGVFALAWKFFNLRVALWSAFLMTITPFIAFFDQIGLVDSMLSMFTI